MLPLLTKVYQFKRGFLRYICRLYAARITLAFVCSCMLRQTYTGCFRFVSRFVPAIALRRIVQPWELIFTALPRPGPTECKDIAVLRGKLCAVSQHKRLSIPHKPKFSVFSGRIEVLVKICGQFVGSVCPIACMECKLRCIEAFFAHLIKCIYNCHPIWSKWEARI